MYGLHMCLVYMSTKQNGRKKIKERSEEKMNKTFADAIIPTFCIIESQHMNNSVYLGYNNSKSRNIHFSSLLSLSIAKQARTLLISFFFSPSSIKTCTDKVD